MVAGRELDALVAEKVMGWIWFPKDDEGPRYLASPDPNSMYVWYPGSGVGTHPLYSTSIAAAWEVWDKLIADGWYPDVITSHVSDGLDYRCELHRGGDGDGDYVISHADTAPLAICLAALAAIGIPLTDPEG